MAREARLAYLNRLLERSNLTQTELARRIGVTQPVVSRILKGRQETTDWRVMVRIVRELRGDIEELLDLVDTPDADHTEGTRRANDRKLEAAIVARIRSAISLAGLFLT
jgi:plasmid maintenance system antidote protein VapI